jgi:signal transduction histidine kinase
MSRSPIEAAWQHCPWGMAVIAADGTVSAFNAAYGKHLGLAQDDLSGKSEADLDALTTSLPQDYRRVEVLRDDVRAIHFLGDASGTEINARHLASIAEMLREPMASVYGFAELLLTQNYDEDTRHELTATLLEQVEAMSNIINQEFDNHKGRAPVAGPQQPMPAIQRAPGESR